MDKPVRPEGTETFDGYQIQVPGYTVGSRIHSKSGGLDFLVLQPLEQEPSEPEPVKGVLSAGLKRPISLGYTYNIGKRSTLDTGSSEQSSE